MNSLEYLKSKNAEIPVNLDLSEKKDYDYLMSIAGGEEKCQKEFPALYQLFQNTVELHAKTHGAHYETLLQNQAFGQMMDDLFVTCLFYDQEQQQYNLEASTSFMSDTDFLLQELVVYDEKNGVLFKDYTLYPDEYSTNFEKGCSGSSIKAKFAVEQETSSISAYFTVVWKEMSELRAQIYKKSFAVGSVIGGAGVKSFQLANPVKKNGSGPIVVVYNRRALSGETFVDYEYNENIKAEGQELYLQVSGSVDMADQAVIMDVFNKDIILRVKSRGTANYKPITDKEVGTIFPLLKEPVEKRRGKPFTFSFDLDWGTVIPSKRLPVKDPVDIFMEIPYVLTNGVTGHLVASSTVYGEKGPHIKQVPQLLLLWGCLEENSLITMGDGSKRPIKEIQIGEVVMGKNIGMQNTGAFRVMDVVQGCEEVLYAIETEDGKSVICSDSHVFPTSERLKQAKELCGEDILIGENNQQLKICALYPCQGGTVYNLVLEKMEEAPNMGTLILSNGVWSGDFTAQNMAAQPRMYANGPNSLSFEADSIRKELETWKNLK